MENIIREYRQADALAVRQCVVELQEFERTIDPRLHPGESMADDYINHIHEQCGNANGRIFVAEHEGDVVGFVAVLAAQRFTELDAPPGSFALVTDLVVKASYRGSGIGSQLLRHAEEFVRRAGATELRIGVLTGNTAARRLYLDAGFLRTLKVHQALEHVTEIPPGGRPVRCASLRSFESFG